MKNLIFLFLLISFTSDAQQNRSYTRTSISVSQTDNKFSLNAKTTNFDKHELQAFLFTELGQPNKARKKSVEWRSDSNTYMFKINRKGLEVKIQRAGMTTMEYDQLVALADEAKLFFSDDDEPSTPATPR